MQVLGCGVRHANWFMPQVYVLRNQVNVVIQDQVLRLVLFYEFVYLLHVEPFQIIAGLALLRLEQPLQLGVKVFNADLLSDVLA